MAQIVTYFYVDKEKIIIDLNKATTKTWNEEIIPSTDKYKTVKENKKNKTNNFKGDKGIDESNHYCKIPIELVVVNPVESKNDVICMIVATYIFTYCIKSKFTNTSTVEENFNIEQKKLIKIIKDNGDKYLLSIITGKDRYHRPINQIHFDFDKYYAVLKAVRTDTDDFDEELC
jgi:hypothetical protein